MKKIWITMTCDEGYVADSLRELAAKYEDEMDDNAKYDSDTFKAEIREFEEEEEI